MDCDGNRRKEIVCDHRKTAKATHPRGEPGTDPCRADRCGAHTFFARWTWERRNRKDCGRCRFSRGALYANFDGKEELFLAVIREEQARTLNVFQSLLKQEPSGKKRLKKFRDAIANLMTDHDWIVLRAEFEVGALRSERIRKNFIEVHRQQIHDGGGLIKDLLRSPDITSTLTPDDLIMVIINLAHGLAVMQRILGTELSQKSTRSLIQSLFDRLISSR